MFNFFSSNQALNESVPTTKSKLYDEKSFYSQFLVNLKCAKDEVIIESPFITFDHTNTFTLVFERLLDKQSE